MTLPQIQDGAETQTPHPFSTHLSIDTSALTSGSDCPSSGSSSACYSPHWQPEFHLSVVLCLSLDYKLLEGRASKCFCSLHH